MYKLFTDGGSRGNPGPAACSCVLINEAGATMQVDAEFLSVATNNFAEYSGLLLGINLAIKNKVKELTCFLDSELVVKQLTGIYAIKDANIKILSSKIFNLKKSFKNIDFMHVRREENKMADRLVNIVLDSALNS